MNAQTERFTIHGPAGILEVARDAAAAPDGAVRGTAVIGHPHPLFAGTMDNKVVQTLARAFVGSGWNALRFNFRGVGQSAGSYDEGRGEREDFLAVVDQLAPQGALALAGFSFGSFVMSHALAELWPRRQIEKVVFVGTAACWQLRNPGRHHAAKPARAPGAWRRQPARVDDCRGLELQAGAGCACEGREPQARQRGDDV